MASINYSLQKNCGLRNGKFMFGAHTTPDSTVTDFIGRPGRPLAMSSPAKAPAAAKRTSLSMMEKKSVLDTKTLAEAQ